MFCQNCGQEIPDDSRFCDYCGQPQQVYDGQGTGEQQGYGPYGEPPVNYDTQGYGNQPVYGTEPKRNSGKLIGIIVCLLAAVVIIVILRACFGGKPTTPLNNIQKIINKQETDITKIVDATTPGFVSDAYKDMLKVLKGNKQYKKEMKEILKNSEDQMDDLWANMFDHYEDKYGKNVKISYKVKKKEKLTKDEKKSISEGYAAFADLSSGVTACIENLDKCTELSDKEINKLVKIVEKLEKKLEKIKVTDGYLMTVDVITKGKDDDDSEKVDIVVIKVDGDWTIDYLSTYLINDSDYDLDEVDEAVDQMELKTINAQMKLAAKAMKEADEDLIEYFADSFDNYFY